MGSTSTYGALLFLFDLKTGFYRERSRIVNGSTYTEKFSGKVSISILHYLMLGCRLDLPVRFQGVAIILLARLWLVLRGELLQSKCRSAFFVFLVSVLLSDAV